MLKLTRSPKKAEDAYKRKRGEGEGAGVAQGRNYSEVLCLC